jgi:hypothetical protein
VLRGAWRTAPAMIVMVGLIEIWMSGCVRVPEADPVAGGPSIDQVVRRVKCDLVRAIEPALEDKKYAWLQSWVAQASLTFIINNAETLTPGATFIQPLTTETLPLRVLMPAARSWNFGLGAGLNTTASRNETVTFSVSLQEIKSNHQSDPMSSFCDYPDLTDLHSDLGLDEWIDAALSPTRDGWIDPTLGPYNYLIPGHHKVTKSGSTSASSGGSQSGSSSSGATGTTSSQTIAASLSLQSTTTSLLRSIDKLIPPTVRVKTKAGECIPPPDNPTPSDRMAYLQCDIHKLLKEISRREIDDPTTPVTTSVTNIAPNQGSSVGGTHVMITGANFSHASDSLGGSVTIGGVSATVTSSPNDSTICAITPSHVASTNPLDVTVNVGGDYKDLEGAGTKFAVFTYSDDLISIAPGSPRSGTMDGGTSVTIQGTDFTGATGVTIGGLPATVVKVDTTAKPNTITATTPQAIKPGVVDVVVMMSPTPAKSSTTTITPEPKLERKTTTSITAPTITTTTTTTPSSDPTTTTTTTTNKTGPGLFTYYAGAVPPEDCPAQATTKKKIIAYVDQNLGQKIDGVLFDTRELVDLVEVCLKHVEGCPKNETDHDLNETLQTAKAVQDSLLTLQLDPPLDAIGHQVQFMIVANASISPSWTLLHFKGPSPGMGSAASATRSLTHTLNIAMGPPSSADVANTLGALQLGTAIGNSIGTGAISITPP